MTLHAAIEAELPFLQQEAEANMTDTFAMYSPGGTDTEDGFEGEGYAPEGSTPGKLAGRSTRSQTGTRTVKVGGMDVVVVEGGLAVPAGSPRPVAGLYGVGWEYELVTAGPLTDASLEGTRWLVVGVQIRSYETERLLDVVQLPQEAP
jgi:hypothetical protein